MSEPDEFERIRAASESDARLFQKTEVLTRAFGVATFITVPVAVWLLVTGRHAVPTSQLLIIAAIAPIGLLVSGWVHRRIARKHGLLALLLLALFAPPAPAQVGGKVTRIVVPFAAGGAREVLARTFYSELGAALGQSIIIENRPGAGGAIGTAAVAKAVPDGTTLIFAASSHNATALLSEQPAYDPIKDFAAVANIGMQSYVLMTNAALPMHRVRELVEYAKANPGKLNYSSPGHGSSGHLAMAYLATLAGIDMVHIPFKSTQDATNDVMAGRSHATIVPNVGVSRDPRIRLLAVTSRRRSSFLPDVPAVAEDLPGYAFESWFGLLAPAGTPKPVIERINAEVAKLLKDKTILARLHAQGVEPRPLSPAAFAKLVADDHATMAKVVKTVGRVQ
jgi:tripartite-type tricarboxylate transporter receptor subunit TctC